MDIRLVGRFAHFCYLLGVWFRACVHVIIYVGPYAALDLLLRHSRGL